MASPPTSSASHRLFDPSGAGCPHATYRELLDTDPVAAMPLSQGAIISRYEDVVFALRNPQIFSSEVSEKLDLGTERPMIPQQIDPPRQTRYRKLLDPFFSRRRMKNLEPAIRRNAASLIESFLESGQCEFNQQFAIPLPGQAFLHLFGLPMEDLSLFLQLKNGIIRPQQQAADPFDAAEIDSIRSRAGQTIYEYFSELIPIRRASPREDLMSSLVSAEIDGTPLSEEEILDICYLQILAGLDTVTATLGCLIAYLAANPEQQRRIYEQPSQIEGAIEELLRWETPVTGVPRIVTQDTEIAGTPLRAGEMVMLLLGAANIDSNEFDEAENVDFERSRNRHIAFGAGHHRCLGSHLARLELRVALEEWHALIPPYSIRAGEVPTYSPGIREVQYLPLSWTARR